MASMNIEFKESFEIEVDGEPFEIRLTHIDVRRSLFDLEPVEITFQGIAKPKVARDETT